MKIIELQKSEEGNASSPKAVQAPKKVEEKTDSYAEKLSYNERREYNKLEKEIQKLEAKKVELTETLSDAATDAEKLLETSEAIAKLIDELDEKELRWLELSERA